MGREGASKGYGNAAIPVKDGGRWNYRVYFGTDKAGFLRHWHEGNQEQIAIYLGYPGCCSAFFQQFWVKDSWRDLIGPMLHHRDDLTQDYRCNVLLRHLGIRPVFHLPCSFSCQATRVLGEKILSYGEKLGFGKEMEWLREILCWPMTWSSLHGVAIVTTPVLKVVYSTDALPNEVKFETTGAYVETAPLKFKDRDTWSDNGFSDPVAQERAHETLLKVVSSIYCDSGRVLDLGCGNGLLLEKVRTKHPYLIPYGVEIDPYRFEQAKDRLRNNVHNCPIQDVREYLDVDFQITLVSMQRFQETPVEEIDVFLTHLRNHTKFLIVYSYGVSWDSSIDEYIARHFYLAHIEMTPYTEARVCKPR